MTRASDIAPMRMAIAVAGLAGLVLAVVIAVVVGSGLIAGRDAEVVEKSETLADLRARALPARAGRSAVPAAEAYLGGETEAIAGNRLQERLTGAVEAAGGTPVSVGLTEVTDGIGGARRIGAEITFQAKNDGLQAVLFTLETGAPYVFVDGLVVQPEVSGRTEDDPPLRVTLTAAAYWRAPAAPAAGEGGS